MVRGETQFKWVGPSVDCYKSALDNEHNTFYKSFMVNGICYELDDFAFIKTVYNGRKIGQLVCFYESSAKWHENATHRGIVKWFTKLSQLPSVYTKGVEFDEENEVVEDLRTKDVFISLLDVRDKCRLVYAELNDPIDVLSVMKLDKKTHFSCRYRLKKDGLIPLIQNLIEEEFTKVNCVKNTPSSDRKKIVRKKELTPKSPIMSKFSNVSVSTPNRAKRNLNESFNNTPSDSPILNYSIVEQENENKKPLKIKLKLSGNQQFEPKVLLEKLSNNYVHDLKKKDESDVIVIDDDSDILVVYDDESDVKSDVVTRLRPRVEKTPQQKSCTNRVEKTPQRKSCRNVDRKSYVEYLSPMKFDNTPTKRSRSNSASTDISNHSSTNASPHKRNRKIGDGIKISPTKRTRANSASESDNKSKNATPVKKNRRNNEAKPIDDVNNLKMAEKNDKVLTKNNGAEEMTARTLRSRAGSTDSCKSNETKPALPLRRGRSSSIAEIISDLKTEYPPTPPKPTRRARAPSIADIIIEDMKKELLDSPRTPRNKRGPKLKTEQLLSPLQEEMTPKKQTVRGLAKTPKNTPSARMKLIRDGVITPSMQSRKLAVVNNNTPLNMAKAKLHVSYVPKGLPCREKEFCDILTFVKGKLLDGCGGCMYISGVPGTGKTATVTDVVRNLEELVADKDVPKFDFVSINGMRLTEPRQSYVEILKQLTGKTIAWEQAQTMLTSRFTKKSTKKMPPIVLLVDELDILCTKRQDVVYNLLDWPTKAVNQLIVITIANTMDLPERLLMGKVTSRLGLTRLTFQAYTHKQLQEIVMNRLMGIDSFKPDAIQLVARKVASVSGDARRALDICRRAAEIAELEGPNTLVAMKHVNESLNAMITQPKVQAIKHCSRLEQLILQAVVLDVERTGVDETTFIDVYTMLASVAGLDGFPMVSTTLASAAVSRLGAARLLLVDQKTSDLHQKLILNVSADDIYYALRQD